MPKVTISDLILLGSTGVDGDSQGTVFAYDEDPAVTDLVDVLDGVHFNTPEGTFGQNLPVGSTTIVNGVEYTLTDTYDFWTVYTKIDSETGETFTQQGQSVSLTLTDSEGNEIYFVSPSDSFNPDDPWIPGEIVSIEVFSTPFQTTEISQVEDGTNKLSNDDDVSIPCFAAGTLIDTSEGLKPVEDIRPGDLVLTRDNGYMPVEWVGSRAIDAAELETRPEFAAVVFRKGALGADLPQRDLRVSPSHRMLVTGPRADLMFGEREVLVPAVHMVGMSGVERDTAAVTYVHIMFESHQVIRGDGAWSESFQPLADTLDGLGDEQRAELMALFPELEKARSQTAYASARMTLKAHEARSLFAA